MKPLLLILLLWALILTVVVQSSQDENCQLTYSLEDSVPRTFTVGVLAIRGFDNAYLEFNSTFTDYLTLTAGQRFTEPVTFHMKPLNLIDLFQDTEQRTVDFIYVNPSAYSCIESEYTAYSLVSQVSRRKVGGEEYQLRQFGGVIAAQADNTEIQSIQDIKDKIVAAASISGLGSGQMQFLEMIENGMSYINDPKQLVFTSNQGKVVNGVLNGDFDVGFVRTDQIERTKDADGNLVNKTLFKILEPKANLTIEGKPFPFASSTPLYPEWNVAALEHVPSVISRQVTEALLALQEHALVGQVLKDCDEEHNSTYCDELLVSGGVPSKRCETTRIIAEAALKASTQSSVVGWQTTLSYMQLRSMQEATGFIRQDPPGSQTWRCIRSAEIYDAITCPAGYARKSKEEVDSGCKKEDLVCKEEFQCLCSPCYKLFTCEDGVTWNGKCVSIVPLILVPILFVAVLSVSAWAYVQLKKRESDSLWLVKPEELDYGDSVRIIGKGSFGFVLLAEYRGTHVAVKRVIPPANSRKDEVSRKFDEESGMPEEQNPGLMTLSHSNFRQRSRLGSFSLGYTQQSYGQIKRDFVSEMRQLSKLRHPCITTVMGAIISGRDDTMLVMEYMSRGSLYEVLRNPDLADELEEKVFTLLRDVARGLRFLHEADPTIIHGDLKSKNVLIDENFRAKVADFGLSSKSKSRHARAGTPYWMAPELFSGDQGSTTASDIYAFGILMYETFTKSNPYEGEDVDEVLRLVCNPNVRKRPPTPRQCSIKIAELYRDTLQHDPKKRPSAGQIDLLLKVEDSVLERTGKLEALNRDLETANETIANASAQQLEHFACMSHEIRTPLNCILGLASIFNDEGLSAEQSDSIQMIYNSGKMLKCIVDDVLDYSKLEAGKIDIQKTPITLQELVYEAVSSMASSSIAAKNDISIRTRIDPLLLEQIVSDGRRLTQVLYNLLSNAVKYSKEGGEVHLSFRILDSADNKCATLIDESSKLTNEDTPCFCLQFTVTDYGKGISESALEEIFKPFSQAKGGVSHVEGGTGLGLAIVTKLVEALGGEISVESRMGEFSSFTVTFPACAQKVDPEIYREPLSGLSVILIGGEGSPDGDYVKEIFDAYGIPYSLRKENDGVETLVDQDSQTKYLFIVHKDLFDAEMYESLSTRPGVHVCTYGLSVPKSRSILSYVYIDRIFPAVFIRQLGEFVSRSARDPTPLRRNSNGSLTSSVSSGAKRSELSTLCVLVAEDNLINQKVLGRLLKRLGVGNAVFVENGIQAVEAEAAQPFDVILMDMQMPEMNGDEAMKLILKRQGGHPHPAIIMASAHVSTDFQHIWENMGASGYLPKPFTIQSLEDALESII